MYTRLYRICGLNIALNTPEELIRTYDWDKFEIDVGRPDVEVSCEKCDKIELNNEEFIGKTTEFEIYRDGDELCRCFRAGAVAAAMSRYNPAKASKVKVSTTEYMWSTVMDERYMWATIALPQIIAAHNGILLHASYIKINGRAVLFSAPCGTGKSTQAALWEKHRGAEIINGDKSAVRISDGEITVHGLPLAGTSGICKNESVPPEAIVLLRQAPENMIKRLSGAQAVTQIMQNVYLDMIAPEERRMALDTVMDIVQNTPVYELSCTPDERAVETLEAELNSK